MLLYEKKMKHPRLIIYSRNVCEWGDRVVKTKNWQTRTLVYLELSVFFPCI